MVAEAAAEVAVAEEAAEVVEERACTMGRCRTGSVVGEEGLGVAEAVVGAA